MQQALWYFEKEPSFSVEKLFVDLRKNIIKTVLINFMRRHQKQCYANEELQAQFLKCDKNVLRTLFSCKVK